MPLACLLSKPVQKFLAINGSKLQEFYALMPVYKSDFTPLRFKP